MVRKNRNSEGIDQIQDRAPSESIGGFETSATAEVPRAAEHVHDKEEPV